MTSAEWIRVTNKNQVRVGDCLRWSDIPGSLAIVLGPGGECPCGMSDGSTFALSDDPPWSTDGNCLDCDISRGVLYRLRDGSSRQVQSEKLIRLYDFP